MIKRRMSPRKPFAHRPGKAEDLDKKPYIVLPADCDMPPLRPDEDDVTMGLEEAELKAARLTKALGKEYVARPYDGPRIVRTRRVDPKYDT